MNIRTVVAVLLFSIEVLFAQGVFFREYWNVFDGAINNNLRETRLRANDPDITLHPNFGKRADSWQNGLALVQVTEDLFQLESAAVYLELWGGHPGVSNKRFVLNGKGTYAIPEQGTVENNCVYSYPLIPIKIQHLVPGTNALLFSVDRGRSFWGNMIIDEAAVRCYLKPDHPDLARLGLQGFAALVQTPSSQVTDQTPLSVTIPASLMDSVASVDYFARYAGYDENSDMIENDWHGYTHDKKYQGHIGHSTMAPFALSWDTRWIPAQGQAMAVMARINFKSGLSYFTPVQDGLFFPAKRKRVLMVTCADLPHPFWVRAHKEQKAHFKIPFAISEIESVRLLVRIWDGGEGTVTNPFTINGHNYPITSGKANHDVVFTDCLVQLSHLKSGDNEIRLLSDTEHHGIEMLLPGPALLVRLK